MVDFASPDLKGSFLPSTPISWCAIEDFPWENCSHPLPPPSLPHQSHRSTHSIAGNKQCVKEGGFTKSSLGSTRATLPINLTTLLKMSV